MRTLQLKRIGTHLALWVGFLAIIVLLLFIQFGRVHFAIFEKITYGAILFYINYLLLIPQFFFKRKSVIYILLSILAIAFILCLPIFLRQLFLDIPLPRHLLGRGFVYKIFAYFFFFVAAIAVRMYEKWKENEEKTQKVHTEQVESELHYLKNQINPHFLFNSLNSIYALTVKKSDQAPEAVITLSEMMRYMLYDTDTKLVPLQKELDYIENYIALQKLRMAESSGVKLVVNGDLKGQMISPLLFIAFIENAFKFGVNSDRKTEITITFTLNGNEVDFCCQNTIGKRREKSEKGIGLKNTKERLELLYPNRHLLTIQESETDYIVNLHLNLGVC